jgi:hypothetical protein
VGENQKQYRAGPRTTATLQCCNEMNCSDIFQSNKLGV